MRWIAFSLAASLAGCTYGAPAIDAAAASTATATIDVNLTASVPASTPYGNAGGFAPAVTTVAVGSTVRFVNRDSFAHTATALGGTGSFPASSPFGAGALTASGARLSEGWSSGTLGAGAASPPLLADRAGTYLYGCFFHYGAPMRAAIVVR